MKNKGLIIFLIAMLSILAITITVCMFWLLSGKGNFGFFSFGNSTVSNELVYDKTYEEIFKEITINSEAGDIYINHNSNNEVTVKIYGNTKQLEVSDKDNLKIKYAAKKCVGFCFNVEKSKIEINLPKDYDGKINIDNKFGDTKVSEFLNSNADINHHYGDITIDGIKDGKINNKCGDIEIGSIATANIENNLGDIKIQKVLSKINVEADCGDIEIDELNLENDSTIENNMGDVSIGRTNELRIDAHTSLGEVNVKNNNSNADITLTIDNSCGDITVKN